MENGELAAPAEPVVNATSELPPAAHAAPADGGVAPEQQQAVDEQPQAPPAPPQQQSRKDVRFSDLTRERNSAREEAAYWRGIAEARAQNSPQPAAQQPEPAAEQDPRPDPAAFEGGKFSEDYLEAVAAWNGREAFRQAQTKAAEAEAARAEEAKRKSEQDAGLERYNAARTEADKLGYHDGADLLDRLPIAVVDDITDSDHPAHVAEWLARNPEHAEALPTLSPRKRAQFIGALDAQIGAVLYKAKQSAPNGGGAAPASASPPAPPGR